MPLIDFFLGKIVNEVGLTGLFILWALYQVYSPEWMPSTKFQNIADDIKSEVRETKSLLVSTITVIRAVVRTNEEIDTDKVDEYLVENGVEPDDFIQGTDMRDSRNRMGDD